MNNFPFHLLPESNLLINNNNQDRLESKHKKLDSNFNHEFENNIFNKNNQKDELQVVINKNNKSNKINNTNQINVKEKINREKHKRKKRIYATKEMKLDPKYIRKRKLNTKSAKMSRLKVKMIELLHKAAEAATLSLNKDNK